MAAAAQESVIASCSFCAKPNTEVETLVAGPGRAGAVTRWPGE